jgi:DNA-binding LacI/PurR family transcriptional regulator
MFDLIDRAEIGLQAAQYMTDLDPRPTAYVIPAIKLAVHFRHAMAVRGIEVGPDAMVIGGDPSHAIESGLSDFPLVGEDVHSAAVHALHLLQRLAERENVLPTQLVVPYQVHNLQQINGKDRACL